MIEAGGIRTDLVAGEVFGLDGIEEAMSLLARTAQGPRRRPGRAPPHLRRVRAGLRPRVRTRRRSPYDGWMATLITPDWRSAAAPERVDRLRQRETVGDQRRRDVGGRREHGGDLIHLRSPVGAAGRPSPRSTTSSLTRVDHAGDRGQPEIDAEEHTRPPGRASSPQRASPVRSRRFDHHVVLA